MVVTHAVTGNHMRPYYRRQTREMQGRRTKERGCRRGSWRESKHEKGWGPIAVF